MLANINNFSETKISLVDDISDHLNKSLALSALLTLDNISSINQDLVEYYFAQIKDELWETREAWQKLSEKL